MGNAAKLYLHGSKVVRYREDWPGRAWRIELGVPRCGDLIFRSTRAGAKIYEHDQVEVNPYGAVAVIASDGYILGLKPGEFTWLSDPPWPSWPADNLKCRACGQKWGGILGRPCWQCRSIDVEEL